MGAVYSGAHIPFVQIHQAEHVTGAVSCTPVLPWSQSFTLLLSVWDGVPSPLCQPSAPDPFPALGGGMLYFGSQETSLDEMLSQGHTASTWQDWDSGVALSLGEGQQ